MLKVPKFLMDDLYIHTLNCAKQDRISDIISQIIVYFEEYEPKIIKIIDPFFKVEEFQGFMNNYSPYKSPQENNLWAFLFYELFEIKPLVEVIIITTKPFKSFLRENKELNKFNICKGGYEYTIKKIKFRFIRYPDPKNLLNKINIIPDLHDRWILLCNKDNVEGLHIGCSLNDYLGKDVTITKFSLEGSKMANNRFDELIIFSEERAK